MSSDSDYYSYSGYRSKKRRRNKDYKFTNRLDRALDEDLQLINRSNSNFTILGNTGNVYTVTISTNPSCTCPDPYTPCKHILFVYIVLLSLPEDDPCLRLHTLQPYQLTRILSANVCEDSLACESTRQRYNELCCGVKKEKKRFVSVVAEGLKCRVCLEVMGLDGRRVVECCTCKHAIHEGCLVTRGDNNNNCVVCGAKWEDGGDEKPKAGYVNLLDTDNFCANCGRLC